MRRALVVLICAMAFAGALASGALAGEVTGPPGSAANPPTNATGATRTLELGLLLQRAE